MIPPIVKPVRPALAPPYRRDGSDTSELLGDCSN